MQHSQDADGTMLNIEHQITEAEVYHSMGLLNESMAAYRKILSDGHRLPTDTFKAITRKVTQLHKDISRDKIATPTVLSERDASTITNMLKTHKNSAQILEGARALRQMGLLDEAVSEYDTFFNSGELACSCFSGQLLREYLSCMLQVRPEDAVINRAEELMHRYPLDGNVQARIRNWLKRTTQQQAEAVPVSDDYHSDPTPHPLHDKHSSDQSTGDSPQSDAPATSRYDQLIRSGVISNKQLLQAQSVAIARGVSTESVLINKFNVKKKVIGDSLATFYRCKFKEFDPDTPVPSEFIKSLKQSFLLFHVWVPLGRIGDEVEILVDDPMNLQKTDHIRLLIDAPRIRLCVAIREDIEQYIHHFYNTQPESPESMIDQVLSNINQFIPDKAFEEEEYTEEKDILDESSSQIVRFVDQMLVTAYRDNVSDIHIEPSQVSSKTLIRFRRDGICHEYLRIPNAMTRPVTSRLKIMANLDIAEKRIPQDGKIKFHRRNIPHFEVRMSTMPTTGGFEDSVLRILADANAMNLDEIKLSNHNYKTLSRMIVQPYGLILVVGPTGSGKTTTLHAALAHINNPSIKIWTAEDPVEITQPGLRQVEVNSKIGVDFATVMRGFLRLDPDVIMIGEMRDEETASAGVEASLTGHLVFSTLHTNSAPETVTRLLDMGLSPLNFSDALLGVLAQRLVRRLCVHCREAYHPDENEFQELMSAYGAEKFKELNIAYDADFTLSRAVGCEKCAGTGYNGRMGIHELLEGSAAVKNLIKKQAATDDIFIQAVNDGMRTLKQDGIQKVLQGLTDMDEIRRVCIDRF